MGQKQNRLKINKLDFEAVNAFFGVDDGARTHDTRNHNPMLYQLNYIHHVMDCKGTKKIVPCKGWTQKNQSADGGR